MCWTPRTTSTFSGRKVGMSELKNSLYVLLRSRAARRERDLRATADRANRVMWWIAWGSFAPVTCTAGGLGYVVQPDELPPGGHGGGAGADGEWAAARRRAADLRPVADQCQGAATEAGRAASHGAMCDDWPVGPGPVDGQRAGSQGQEPGRDRGLDTCGDGRAVPQRDQGGPGGGRD